MSTISNLGCQRNLQAKAATSSVRVEKMEVPYYYRTWHYSEEVMGEYFSG
jgi:hypothetical protein